MPCGTADDGTVLGMSRKQVKSWTICWWSYVQTPLKPPLRLNVHHREPDGKAFLAVECHEAECVARTERASADPGRRNEASIERKRTPETGTKPKGETRFGSVRKFTSAGSCQILLEGEAVIQSTEILVTIPFVRETVEADDFDPCTDCCMTSALLHVRIQSGQWRGSGTVEVQTVGISKSIIQLSIQPVR